MENECVIITGVGGFIGSHMAEYLLDHTTYDVIGIDSWNPWHRGSKHRVDHLKQNRKFRTLELDLSVPIPNTTQYLISDLTQHHTATHVVNFASDSHVTRSIQDPTAAWTNNCRLIVNVLEWMRTLKPATFIQISTDEVYGEVAWDSTALHHEWDVMLPSNPYAASKAAQEALCIAYWRTFNLPLILTNTMNVIGERQDPEKVIPKFMRLIQQEQPVSVHVDAAGRAASRVFIDAKDVALALTLLLRGRVAYPYDQQISGHRPARFNIAGASEVDMWHLALLIGEIMEKPVNVKKVRGDLERPGYDRRYGLTNDKIAEAVGFLAEKDFRSILSRVVRWTLSNREWLSPNVGDV